MANKLPFPYQVAAINALVEGNSIRSTERMIGVHRDTIMRLAVRVGEACATALDERMRGLKLKHLQLDELVNRTPDFPPIRKLIIPPSG
jgi:Trm5-related predicted tRNA methylase